MSVIILLLAAVAVLVAVGMMGMQSGLLVGRRQTPPSNPETTPAYFERYLPKKTSGQGDAL